jgi:hypothetical protein
VLESCSVNRTYHDVVGDWILNRSDSRSSLLLRIRQISSILLGTETSPVLKFVCKLDCRLFEVLRFVAPGF